MVVVEGVDVVGVKVCDVNKVEVLIGGVVVGVDTANDEDVSERRRSGGVDKGSGGGVDNS